MLERIRGELEAHAVVEQFPKMEGRQLVMVMSPKKGGKAPVKSAPAKVATAPVVAAPVAAAVSGAAKAAVAASADKK